MYYVDILTLVWHEVPITSPPDKAPERWTATATFGSRLAGFSDSGGIDQLFVSGIVTAVRQQRQQLYLAERGPPEDFAIPQLSEAAVRAEEMPSPSKDDLLNSFPVLLPGTRMAVLIPQSQSITVGLSGLKLYHMDTKASCTLNATGSMVPLDHKSGLVATILRIPVHLLRRAYGPDGAVVYDTDPLAVDTVDNDDNEDTNFIKPADFLQWEGNPADTIVEWRTVLVAALGCEVDQQLANRRCIGKKPLLLPPYIITLTFLVFALVLRSFAPSLLRSFAPLVLCSFALLLLCSSAPLLLYPFFPYATEGGYSIFRPGRRQHLCLGPNTHCAHFPTPRAVRLRPAHGGGLGRRCAV